MREALTPARQKCLTAARASLPLQIYNLLERPAPLGVPGGTGCHPRRGGGLYDRPIDDVKRFVETK